MKNIFKYSPGFLAGVILSSAFAGAAAANSNLITNTIDELWVFVAGDPVLASQVNENFEYLDLDIGANFDAIESNSDDIVANTVSILNNEDNIFVNQGAIVSNNSDISSLESSNSLNAANISSNASNISINDARITNLEGSQGGTLSYSLGDLIDSTWQLTFVNETNNDAVNPPGGVEMSFSPHGDYYQLDEIDYFQNSIWWPSGIGTYVYATHEMDINSDFWRYQGGHVWNGTSSFIFGIDGSFFAAWKGIRADGETTNHWLALSGSMNINKDKLEGKLYFNQTTFGTFTAVKQ